jgi:hypothetical protein
MIPSTAHLIGAERLAAEEATRRERFPTPEATAMLRAQQAETAKRCQKLDAMRKAAIGAERKSVTR